MVLNEKDIHDLYGQHITKLNTLCVWVFNEIHNSVVKLEILLKGALFAKTFGPITELKFV